MARGDLSLKEIYSPQLPFVVRWQRLFVSKWLQDYSIKRHQKAEKENAAEEFLQSSLSMKINHSDEKINFIGSKTNT